MQIEGEIKSIIFNNESNGYTVAKLYREQYQDFSVIVGKFFSIRVGERVKLVGNYITNPKYGQQFAFDSFEIVYPTSASGIKTFLSSGLIKGIGPVTAEKIVARFGNESLDVIEFSHQRLVEVPGISPKKASIIHEHFYNYKHVQNIIIFLSEYNISVNMALKIYEQYKENTIKRIEQNPYGLVEDVEGIGFATADKIAGKFGVAKNSEFRIRAGIMHALTTAADRNGHTYLSYEDLHNLLEDILSLNAVDNAELFNKVIEDLVIQKNLVKVFNGFEHVLMLNKFYFGEKYIADKIAKVIYSFPKARKDIFQDIKHFEQINNITFHEEQIKAITTAINNGVCVITGGPGTGKTTIINCIISILENLGIKTALLAPTGRASNRMSQTTGKEASTIHRALAMDFHTKRFAFNQSNPLDYAAVIVDEFSMVDALLAANLLKALKNDCKIILVGDKDQLPSVGAGNVLDDIIKSQCVEVVNLTQIYRQDEKSKIITNAHLINNGQMPEIDNTSNDFFFEEHQELDKIKDTVIDLATRRLVNFLKMDPTQIQILAAMKNGVCGIDNLNVNLQQKINPSSLKKDEVEVGHVTFRVGDKVMQTANNYNLEWVQQLSFHRKVEGSGVFNGDIGYIKSINRQTGEVEVEFENGRNCIYPRSELYQLSLAYAITIHKSQGSEFDVIVIPIISGPSIILNRNLIYTAVTRAKKMVVLVGQKKHLQVMIRNKFIIKRFTMLKYFLEKSCKNAKELFQGT